MWIQSYTTIVVVVVSRVQSQPRAKLTEEQMLLLQGFADLLKTQRIKKDDLNSDISSWYLLFMDSHLPLRPASLTRSDSQHFVLQRLCCSPPPAAFHHSCLLSFSHSVHVFWLSRANRPGGRSELLGDGPGITQLSSSQPEKVRTREKCWQRPV